MIRMAFIMKENEPANPGDISLLSAQAEVLDAQDGPHLIQKFGCGHKVVRVIASEVSAAPV